MMSVFIVYNSSNLYAQCAGLAFMTLSWGGGGAGVGRMTRASKSSSPLLSQHIHPTYSLTNQLKQHSVDEQ